MRSYDALELLHSSATFDMLSDGLKELFAELMTLDEVEDGHIFIEEGEEIKRFLILESGVLLRYKLGSAERMSPLERAQSFTESVLLDTVEGRGRVTGLLHNFAPGHRAYATIVSKGHVKAWSIDGEALRKMLLEHPEHGLELMGALAFRLRRESKLSRALIGTSALGAANGMATNDDELDGAKRILKVKCFDTTSWVHNGFTKALEKYNQSLQDNDQHLEIQFDFTDERLGGPSASQAAGYEAVCTFVNDTADSDVVQALSLLGVKMIAQRAAGFDRIDTKAARTFGMTVARVPAYSPYAVAEMAISLLMTVNRRITRANARVKMANFTLDEGLMGVDIHGKTVGVMGTGKIGSILCNIILGFGAKLICYDVFPNESIKAAGGTYVTQDELYQQSDIVFLMMPLLPATKHTISMDVLPKLKPGMILINTSRGGLIDTKALLEGLKTGRISGVGMDVYENEQDYFFQDWSTRRIPDPELVALLGNHNVVLTAHQAFFTKEAVDKIISTTLDNLRDFALGKTGFDHPNNCIPAPK